MASAKSAAVGKWWKKEPVVTPASAATPLVVSPAYTRDRGRSSSRRWPARTRRSREEARAGSFVAVGAVAGRVRSGSSGRGGVRSGEELTTSA